MRRFIVGFVIATLMSGTAYAATHYVITSTSQIKPSILQQLRGARGPAGPAGTTDIVISRSTSTGSACQVGTSCASVNITATCPVGSFVTGGAVHTSEAAPGITTLTYVDSTSYGAQVVNTSTYAVSVTVVAICMHGAGIIDNAY